MPSPLASPFLFTPPPSPPSLLPAARSRRCPAADRCLYTVLWRSFTRVNYDAVHRRRCASSFPPRSDYFLIPISIPTSRPPRLRSPRESARSHAITLMLFICPTFVGCAIAFPLASFRSRLFPRSLYTSGNNFLLYHGPSGRPNSIFARSRPARPPALTSRTRARALR